MYSIDLNRITLDEFETMMLTARLLPFQQPIINNLSDNMHKLKLFGVLNLFQMQNLLRNKKKYPSIAEDTDIDENYFIILRMMVNSYVVKTVPLLKLNIFSNDELEVIENKNIKNSKQYYETFIKEIDRSIYSQKYNIPIKKLEYALRIIDLLRINGVGVKYAKMLYNIGVKCINDYNNTSSETILKKINKLNKDKTVSKATLGISDIDYCRRFSEKLDNDII